MDTSSPSNAAPKAWIEALDEAEQDADTGRTVTAAEVHQAIWRSKVRGGRKVRQAP